MAIFVPPEALSNSARHCIVIAAIAPAPMQALWMLTAAGVSNSLSSIQTLLCYCRNIRPTWVKFNSKDTKESEWCFEVLSTKSKKRT